MPFLRRRGAGQEAAPSVSNLKGTRGRVARRRRTARKAAYRSSKGMVMSGKALRSLASPRCLAAALVVFSLTLVIAAGCGGGGSSGPGVGSIQGYVFGQTSAAAAAGKAPAIAIGRGPTPPAGFQPLAGAVVRVTGSNTIATTDATGYFRIDNVVAGAQRVTASHSGFLSAVVPVTVVAGQLVTVQDALLTPSVRKWTFMVYLNGDNNLEQFGILNLNQMEMVGSSPEVDIVVQAALPGAFSGTGALAGCHRLRMIKDNDENTVTSPVLQDLGPTDMGDWRNLHDFIVWAMANYPAEHYCLDIWNHGAGWRAAAASPVTRGVSFDDLFGTSISIPNLPRALDVQPRLDIIAFDASLMQMVEVAYQIRHYGQIMVGSEESPPGQGYPYQTFLESLVEAPTEAPQDFAAQIVTETLDYYARIGFTSGLTQSAVALDQMDNVALNVDTFARALATANAAFSAQIASARTQAQHYAYFDNKDLVNFAQLISQLVPQANVTSAAQGVMTAVDSAVFAEDHNQPLANSHGLAIYIPNQSTFALYAPAYEQLEFALNTAWDDWLAISPP